MYKKVKNFLFINSSDKQTVVKNTFWLFLSEAGMRILKLFIFIYAARKLGTSEWGVFSYILALIGVFSTISDIGINSILTREVAKKSEDGKQYISTSFFLKLILSFTASISFLIFAFLTKNTSEIKVLLPIAAIILFLDSMREFGFAINRAFEKMETEAFAKVTSVLVLVIFGFIFISQNHSALSFLNAYLMGSIFGIIIMYITLRNYFSKIYQTYDKNYLLPILKEAWPIAVISGFGIIMANIDTIFLGMFRGNSEIGIYAAAQKPVQLMYIIPGLLSTALLPIFSRMAKNNIEKTNEIINKTIKLTILISAPIVIGGIILGTPIINFLFGQQYIESAPLFKIMITAIITGSIGGIVSNALFAQNKQKKIMYYIIIGAIINFILCFSLIPFFGMYGAAISVTISSILINVLLFTNFKKDNSLKINFELIKMIFALFTMIISIFIFQKFINIILLLILSSIIYVISLIILRESFVSNLIDRLF